MRTFKSKESAVSSFAAFIDHFTLVFFLFFFSLISMVSPAKAQLILFDFDNAPLYTPLPIIQTAGGITAHLSATGQGYSVQDANVLGFTPPGFAGHILDPSSINLSDLLISFNHTLIDFSIMYSCQELGCNDAATMRVTAYMNGNLVGTNTKVAGNPGTWPVDTLRCTFSQGFDSVVVHYDSHPPTCQDYGVIYLADNMRVTAMNTGMISSNIILDKVAVIPNPVSEAAIISFTLMHSENINITIYDLTGRMIKNLFDGTLTTGDHKINWKANEVERGVYFLNISGKNFSQTYKLITVK